MSNTLYFKKDGNVSGATIAAKTEKAAAYLEVSTLFIINTSLIHSYFNF